jgi:hypothetical protein
VWCLSLKYFELGSTTLLVDYERVLFDACGIALGHGGFSFFYGYLDFKQQHPSFFNVYHLFWMPSSAISTCCVVVDAAQLE